MRVLYVSPSLTVHDRRFLAAFVAWGYEPLYASFGRPDRASGMTPLPDGVRLVHWEGEDASVKTPADVGALVRPFANVLARVAPDVVHAGPLPTCAYLAARAGAQPLVAMAWGFDVLVDADRDIESRDALRLAVERAARVVCDCDTVRQRIREIAGTRDDVFVQLPWGT